MEIGIKGKIEVTTEIESRGKHDIGTEVENRSRVGITMENRIVNPLHVIRVHVNMNRSLNLNLIRLIQKRIF